MVARVLREPVNACAASVLQVKVTAEAAGRFLVARHFLAPARSLAGGLDGVLEVFRKLGSIQFDPIAVAGRNHDLVLHARVAGYEPAWCDVLYERREIFEATNKALSFVATSEFPWFRHVMGRKGPRFHAAVLADNAAVAERVLGRIRADGPLSSHDFERETGPTKDWFGMPENAVRAVLEAYTVTGVIGLARRDGNLRYYDLLERLLPAELLAQEVPEREQLLHKLLSRYRAHGLLGAGGAGGTFERIAPPRSTPERVGRNTLLEELIELGALVPVQVEGVRGERFVLAEELALLQAPPEPTPSVAFIPPFDSLLWDNALVTSLFDFRLRVGGILPAGKAPVGLLRAVDRLPRSLRRPDRAAHRPRGWGRARAERLVGERLRSAARRRVRRRDARRPPRLPAFRRREPPRLGTASRNQATAVPHAPVKRRGQGFRIGRRSSSLSTAGRRRSKRQASGAGSLWSPAARTVVCGRKPRNRTADNCADLDRTAKHGSTAQDGGRTYEARKTAGGRTKPGPRRAGHGMPKICPSRMFR